MSDTHPSDSMTRRQLLIAAGAGAVGIAAGAWGIAQIPDETRARVETEIEKLRALVKLYEQLEKIGLDNILASALNVMRGLFDALKAGIRLVRDGIAVAQTAWKNFQALLAGLKTAADGAANALAELQKKFRAAESVVVAALGAVSPLAESIANFFAALIQKIPFGIGDNIQRAVTALVDLVRAIPPTIETLTTQLLKSLSDTFFPQTGKTAFSATVMDPITTSLLSPLEKFLSEVESAITRWETEFAKPIQNALDERKIVRKQIAEYRQQFNV